MESIKKNRVINKEHEYVVNGVLDSRQLSGRWKLEYLITNTLGANGFGSVSLEPYMHPETRLWQYPMVDGQPKVIVEITAKETIYDPDNNPNHKSLINWMLNHPRVKIDGMKMDSNIQKNKKANSKFKLYNVDLQDFEEFQDENIIDKMVGLLTLETGVNAIGKEKLKYISAKLNLPFRDRRVITNPKAEKLILQNKIKNFVKKSKENALLVNDIVNNLEDAKKHYCIKELIESGDIAITNGMLKYKHFVLGMNIDSAAHFLEQNAECWLEIQGKVSEKLKE